MTERRSFAVRRTVVPLLALALVACAGTDDAAQDSLAALDSAAAAAGTITMPAGDTAMGATAAPAGSMLDPNTVTREQLTAVPGMTATTADALVAGRPYENMLGVERVLVAGQVGEADRDSVYTRVWMPLDLNTASDEEILLIPGLGPRMLHEFKEYRPYTAIEQFRREIGKYVDEQEVARFERYVTIR